MLDYLVLIMWAYIFPVNIIRLVGHLFIKFFCRFGLFSFFLYMAFWILCVILIFLNRDLFLLYRLYNPSFIVKFIGIVLFSIGMVMQVLGFRALGMKAVFAIPEILPKETKTALIIKGPFSLVRHPLYLGQLLLAIGALLITFELSLCILLGVTIILVWPITALEEKELIERFGEEYRKYQSQVPRIFLKIKI